jgi:hypothetical protein
MTDPSIGDSFTLDSALNKQKAGDVLPRTQWEGGRYVEKLLLRLDFNGNLSGIVEITGEELRE